MEVAFKGKGFEGSWATATVVKPDGRKNVLVRYCEFVDNDGTPLVEQGESRAHRTHAPAPAPTRRPRLSPPSPLSSRACASRWLPAGRRNIVMMSIKQERNIVF